MPPHSLEQLFRNYLDTGDEAALEHCMHRCRAPLRRLARRLGTDACDAEDLIQETFIAAIEGAARFDPNRPLLPWLKGILTFRAAHLARGDLRRRRHHGRLPSRQREPANPPDLDRVELDADVRAAIDDLPSRYREPLAQYLLAERSPVEIAESLGVERSTLRVRLHRGMRRLRDALRRWAPPALLLAFGRRAWAAARSRAVAAAGATASFALAIAFAVSMPWNHRVDAPATAGGEIAAVSADDERTDERTSPASRVAAPAPQRELLPVANDAHGLSFTVTQRDGHGVAGVGLTLEPAWTLDPLLHRRTRVTDAAGRARWHDLAPGIYRVTADRNTTWRRTSQLVTVDGRDPSFAIALLSDRRTRGVVVDAEGRPVAGASVWLGCEPTGPWRGQEVTHTDDAGRFELFGLPTGALLAARHPRLSRGPAVRLARPADQTDDVVRLELGPRGRSLTLEVQDEQGIVVADAAVHVGYSADATPLALAQGATPWTSPPLVGRTDRNGRFATLALRPGRHPVVVRAVGMAPLRSWLTVTADGSPTHRLRMTRGATLSGRIRSADGQPIAGATVRFHSGDAGTAIGVRTDDAGRFLYESLPAGDGCIVVSSPGRAPTVHALCLAAGRHDHHDLTLAAATTILGTIVPPNGTWSDSVQVQAQWPPSALHPDQVVVEADTLGRFRLPNRQGKRPRLRLRLAGEPLFRAVDDHVSWYGDQATILLPAHWAADCWIEGTCRDERSRGISAARVFVCRNETSWAEVDRTDDRGRYRIGPLPPGRYRVFAESTSPDAPTLVGEVRELLQGCTEHCDLQSRQVGGVKVTLLRTDGQPADHVLATIQRADLPRRVARADRATFEQRLVAGDYVLSVLGRATEWIDAHPFTVRAGQTTDVRVELRAASLYRLRPRGLPPRMTESALDFTIAEVGGNRPPATIRIQPDAAVQIAAVLPHGDYLLRHVDAAGRNWTGAFSIDASADGTVPRSVPMHASAR
ncbi:MAG TPA: sigma-70 family RNA polymerase sigma factor [bacterium]|nr:sigma-70 family RNA polymerase sigma factor [bacterium]